MSETKVDEENNGTLTWDEFLVASKQFIEISRKLGDNWRLEGREEKDNPGTCYLTTSFFREADNLQTLTLSGQLFDSNKTASSLITPTTTTLSTLSTLPSNSDLDTIKESAGTETCYPKNEDEDEKSSLEEEEEKKNEEILINRNTQSQHQHEEVEFERKKEKDEGNIDMIEEIDEEEGVEVEVVEIIKSTNNDKSLLRHEYHVVYALSFMVPVIYYNISRSDGSLLSLEQLWALVQPKLSSNVDIWSTLTQKEHPILNTPFYSIHPCNTANFMKNLNISNKKYNYLISWMSLIAPIVGFPFNTEKYVQNM